MAVDSLSPLVKTLRRAATADFGRFSDRQLLQRFLARRDETAFSALVKRHGPRVLAACRRVLADAADCDDAFQATFLVLFRKANSVRWQPSVGSWLTAVAHRLAVRARSEAGKRKLREAKADRSESADAPDLTWREARDLLHEELDRLPDRFRLPLLHCYLEGQSRDEAAGKLGWTVGRVKAGLERGRNLLRDRLGRRGVTLAVALLVPAAGSSALAAVPGKLADSAVSLAFSNGTSSTATAAVLARGVLAAMTANQFKKPLIALVALGLLAAGFWGAAVPAASEVGGRDGPAPGGAAATVKGRVVGPDGKPVAGAKLFMAADIKNPVLEPKQVGTTGADGRFAFETVVPPTGYFRLLTAVADGFGPDWIDPAEVNADGDLTLRLTSDDVPITGRLRDLQGKPAAGATVRVAALLVTPSNDLAPILRTWSNEPSFAVQEATKRLPFPVLAGLGTTATVDADGRFRVTGVGRDRIVVLSVRGDGLENQTLWVVTRPGFDPATVTPDDNVMRLKPPGLARRPAPILCGPTLDRTLGPGRAIEGTVRDAASGRPVAGVQINGTAEVGWHENTAKAVSDADGKYRLTGLPKTAKYRVMVFAGPDSQYLPAGLTLSDAEGLAPITADIVLTHGVNLTGRITDKRTGKAISASIRYVPLADNKFFPKTPGNEFFGMGAASYSTDADGRFRLMALPGSGLLLVQAHTPADGSVGYTQAYIEEKDRPKAFEKPFGNAMDAFPAADGHVEVLMLHNAYRLIDPAGDAAAFTADFQLDPGLAVTATVVGPDGKPYPGASAARLSAVSSKATKLNGAEFRAVALDTEHPRTVIVFDRDKHLVATATLRGDEKESPVVKLQQGGAVTGRVLNENGKPVPAAEVMIQFQSGLPMVTRLSGTYPEMYRTDADGRFRVEGVYPGEPFNVMLSTGRKVIVRQNGLQVAAAATRDLGDINLPAEQP